MEEKATQPPKRFSPASIVKKLEDLELGTKATRAEVIETLYSRDYITDKKSIHVTQFGLCVYEALSQHCPSLLNEELTREFEKEMELITENKVKPEKIIQRAKETVSTLCAEFKQHEIEIGKHLVTALNSALRQAAELGPCKCSGTLLIRHSKFGQFVGCAKYPECKVTFPLPHSASINKTEKICDKCGTPIIGVRRKAKKFFSMCLDPKCETKANWGHKNDYNKDKPAEKTSEVSVTSAAPSVAATALVTAAHSITAVTSPTFALVVTPLKSSIIRSTKSKPIKKGNAKNETNPRSKKNAA